MKRPLWTSLIVLVVGNALLWSGMQQVALDGAEARLRSALAEVVGASMSESRFPESELMPADYVLMVGATADAPLLSVYAANFPRDGLGLVRAHDPGICYVNAGWLLRERVTNELAVDGRRPGLLVYRFEHGAEQRVVLSWRQPLGRVVDAGRPWWRDGIDRLVHGRQDFVWVRVEVLAEVWGGRRTEVEELVARLMRAIEARFAAG
jgi:hypothetical protein